MKITAETIKSDIAHYQERIRAAELRLSELPDHSYGWASQRKTEQLRKGLLQDIAHINRLIEYARGSLTG